MDLSPLTRAHTHTHLCTYAIRSVRIDTRPSTMNICKNFSEKEPACAQRDTCENLSHASRQTYLVVLHFRGRMRHPRCHPILVIHTFHTYIQYTHVIHICHAHFSYIHVMHTFHTYISYIHFIHTFHTYMSYIHVIHTFYTHISYIHVIHTCHTYMSYIHVIHTCHTNIAIYTCHTYFSER